MASHNESFPLQENLNRETWPSVPSLPLLTGSTIMSVGPKFYVHSPTTILKIAGRDDGEGIMTALAHSILGPCVPRVVTIVTIPSITRRGLVLTRKPGTPLSELWPSLSTSQRENVKEKLCRLLVCMRAHHFTYYGRPGRQPYIIFDIFGTKKHAYCASRSDWDESRVRALQVSCSSDVKRVEALERVQRRVSGSNGWDRPVLTHGDLSDRNILVHPHTLNITGFLDWEAANIMPAYYEYVEARLSGGHDPEWRMELLDVLRSVLRRECGTNIQGKLKLDKFNEGQETYERNLAAWNAVTDVERIAQEYNDDCSWTFETGLPDASQNANSAL